MPNRTTPRSQRKPKSKKPRRAYAAAGPVAWATGGQRTEIKAFYQQNANFQLYHNTAWPYYNTSNLLDYIINGTTYNARIGNKVFIKDLDIVMILNNKSDRPNVTYRVSVCAAPLTLSTDTGQELFAFGGMSALHVITNSELLSDTFFPVNQGSTMSAPTKERSHVYKLTLPINRPVVYNNDGTCATRLVAFVTAFDAFGTLVTDNIASVAQTSFRITFTDT